MMTYTVHIHYSKYGASDVEEIEMVYNYGYDKIMTAQKQGLPSVPKKYG